MTSNPEMSIFVVHVVVKRDSRVSIQRQGTKQCSDREGDRRVDPSTPRTRPAGEGRGGRAQGSTEHEKGTKGSAHPGVLKGNVITASPPDTYLRYTRQYSMSPKTAFSDVSLHPRPQVRTTK